MLIRQAELQFTCAIWKKSFKVEKLLNIKKTWRYFKGVLSLQILNTEKATDVASEFLLHFNEP